MRPKADPPAAVTVGGRATARKPLQHGSHFRRRAHSGHGTQAQGFGSPSSKLFPCGFVPRNHDSTSRPYKGTKEATSRCQGMSEHAVPAAFDPVGHRPGCSHYGEVNEADSESLFVDLFCDCHDNAEPQILANGSDIAWPVGWNEQMASEWRGKNGLAPPPEPGSGP